MKDFWLLEDQLGSKKVWEQLVDGFVYVDETVNMVTLYSRLRRYSTQLICSSAGPLCSSATYSQGQSPSANIREYFYFIDHYGQLFLDDVKIRNFTSAFKEPKFLEFFFSRVKVNNTGRYESEFPYLSLCGRERNYLRCDDTPLVFISLLQESSEVGMPWYLAYGSPESRLLRVLFQPTDLYMCPTSGRIYHPTYAEGEGSRSRTLSMPLTFALISSPLALSLGPSFQWSTTNSRHHSPPPDSESETPTHFCWHGTAHLLSKRLSSALHERRR